MDLCSIASGSSGNCVYVGNENTGMLVDAGISKKRIEDGLGSIDVNPERLKGILVTHEHSDHISGLGVFTRKYQVPVYGTRETLLSICETKSLGAIDTGLFREVVPDRTFYIDDIKVNPFSISHDAKNPVCYTFEKDSKKVGVATDLGTFNDYIISYLENCDALLMEANHDINMLQVGAYPYALKRRILGDRGHLSNDNSGRLLTRLLSSRLRYIFLGHLSKENNYPELAYETVRCELSQAAQALNTMYKLEVADRDMPSAFVSV